MIKRKRGTKKNLRFSAYRIFTNYKQKMFKQVFFLKCPTKHIIRKYWHYQIESSVVIAYSRSWNILTHTLHFKTYQIASIFYQLPCDKQHWRRCLHETIEVRHHPSTRAHGQYFRVIHFVRDRFFSNHLLLLLHTHYDYYTKHTTFK